MRWFVIGLLFIAACTTTTSVTRTRTGIFAPKNAGDDDGDSDAPRGLSLSIESIAHDGTVAMTLRNYSDGPFTFGGTREAPDLILEARSGATQSRHTLSHGRGGTETEAASGEHFALKTVVVGAAREIRIGIRSRDGGYILWTPWTSR